MALSPCLKFLARHKVVKPKISNRHGNYNGTHLARDEIYMQMCKCRCRYRYRCRYVYRYTAISFMRVGNLKYFINLRGNAHIYICAGENANGCKYVVHPSDI